MRSWKAQPTLSLSSVIHCCCWDIAVVVMNSPVIVPAFHYKQSAKGYLYFFYQKECLDSFLERKRMSDTNTSMHIEYRRIPGLQSSCDMQ